MKKLSGTNVKTGKNKRDLAEQLRADMNSMDVLARMEQDKKDSIFLKVSATPEYFVNGRPLPSFGQQQLANLVREELEKYDQQLGARPEIVVGCPGRVLDLVEHTRRVLGGMERDLGTRLEWVAIDHHDTQL